MMWFGFLENVEDQDDEGWQNEESQSQHKADSQEVPAGRGDGNIGRRIDLVLGMFKQDIHQEQSWEERIDDVQLAKDIEICHGQSGIDVAYDQGSEDSEIQHVLIHIAREVIDCKQDEEDHHQEFDDHEDIELFR